EGGGVDFAERQQRAADVDADAGAVGDLERGGAALERARRVAAGELEQAEVALRLRDQPLVVEIAGQRQRRLEARARFGVVAAAARRLAEVTEQHRLQRQRADVLRQLERRLPDLPRARGVAALEGEHAEAIVALRDAALIAQARAQLQRLAVARLGLVEQAA